MIDQAEQAKGAPAPAPSETQPPPVPPQPPPPPEAAQADLALPPPPLPPRPASQAPPGPPSPPTPRAHAAPQTEVNLSGIDEDRDPLLVTGDVVPPRPDALIHNQPPSYPPDAAHRHAQGTVRLRIHVTDQGAPGQVDVAISSGDHSLDRAALDAVALWRFQPARAAGRPVPFDYEVDFHFRL